MSFIYNNYDRGVIININYINTRRLEEILSNDSNIKWIKRPSIWSIGIDGEFMIGKSKFFIKNIFSDIDIESSIDGSQIDIQKLHNIIGSLKWKWWWFLL